MSSPAPELAVRIGQDRPFPLQAELDCAGGELLALVGPSGSGKSTLLRMVAGLSRPARGRIALGRTAWFDAGLGVFLSPQQRRVGYLPQHLGLFPHLSAQANIEAGLGHLARRARAPRARAWLARMHLDGLHRRRPQELSGGQQQRVALARALAREPSVLLLDEPFSAVDRVTREHLWQELAELKRELSCPTLLVTHDLAEALLLADRMCLLEHGRTLQSGPPQEVLARPVSVGAARLLGHDNVFEGTVRGHAPEAGWTWVELGGIRLAAGHRPDLAPGARIHAVLPGEAVRLPGIGGRPLREGPNRLQLHIVQWLPMGDEVRLRATVDGLAAPLALRIGRRLGEALALGPQAQVAAQVEPLRIHLIRD
ncbi:MAG: ABC transporter [Lysobacteraceae bacterium]|nr:MAG: ABC transporter [Xanthomonadaceae bacterium]